jgi:hypothetical protein
VRQRRKQRSIDAVDLSNRGGVVLGLIDILIHELTIIEQIVTISHIDSTFLLDRATIVV